MRRVGTLIALLASLTSLMIGRTVIATADSDEDGGVFDRQSTVQAADGSLKIHARIGHAKTPLRSGGGLPLIPPARKEPAPGSTVGMDFCAGTNIVEASGGAPALGALCGFVPVGGVSVVPGRAEVLAAFREIGLYRGGVRSDPALVSFVNLETFFWCGDGGGTCAARGEGERTVTLLGQSVRIRPRIVGYEWRFGDGSAERVTAARVAHTYGHAGAMAVSVTLTWTADYAVGGGGFRAIGGTTTTTSPVRVLPVQEAATVTVG
jgi:hypothetical protein